MTFTRNLLDESPTDCRHMVTSEAISAGVLSPRDHYVSGDPNITLVGCVKGIAIPTDGSAFLHVVDGETHFGSNPVPFMKDACSIVWQDVPVGSYEVFVQVLDINDREIARSSAVQFSRTKSAAHPAKLEPGGRNAAASTLDRIPYRQFNHEAADLDEWPIFSKLHNSAHQFCGFSGWQEVSVHEVMSVFLQSEWYKEEHAEWRKDSLLHNVVMQPNISDGNENVIRAMLLATPRKVVSNAV